MIIGIDPSLTGTGMAFLHKGGAIQMETVSSKPGPIEPRLLDLMRRINALIGSAVGEPTFKPDLVLIEALSFGSNDPSAQERAALHFLIRIQLHSQGIPFRVVAPTSLKKFVCGTGAAKKEMVLKEIFRRWSVDAADNNQADAAGLAFIGATILGRREPDTQAQREVISKLAAPPMPKVRKMRNRAQLA